MQRDVAAAIPHVLPLQAGLRDYFDDIARFEAYTTGVTLTPAADLAHCDDDADGPAFHSTTAACVRQVDRAAPNHRDHVIPSKFSRFFEGIRATSGGRYMESAVVPGLFDAYTVQGVVAASPTMVLMSYHPTPTNPGPPLLVTMRRVTDGDVVRIYKLWSDAGNKVRFEGNVRDVAVSQSFVWTSDDSYDESKPDNRTSVVVAIDIGSFLLSSDDGGAPIDVEVQHEYVVAVKPSGLYVETTDVLGHGLGDGLWVTEYHDIPALTETPTESNLKDAKRGRSEPGGSITTHAPGHVYNGTATQVQRVRSTMTTQPSDLDPVVARRPAVNDVSASHLGGWARGKGWSAFYPFDGSQQLNSKGAVSERGTTMLVPHMAIAVGSGVMNIGMFKQLGDKYIAVLRCPSLPGTACVVEEHIITGIEERSWPGTEGSITIKFAGIDVGEKPNHFIGWASRAWVEQNTLDDIEITSAERDPTADAYDVGFDGSMMQYMRVPRGSIAMSIDPNTHVITLATASASQGRIRVAAASGVDLEGFVYEAILPAIDVVAPVLNIANDARAVLGGNTLTGPRCLVEHTGATCEPDGFDLITATVGRIFKEFNSEVGQSITFDESTGRVIVSNVRKLVQIADTEMGSTMYECFESIGMDLIPGHDISLFQVRCLPTSRALRGLTAACVVFR